MHVPSQCQHTDLNYSTWDRQGGVLRGIRIHHKFILVRPQVHHAIGVSEPKAVAGRAHVHGTHHDLLRAGLEAIDDHAGRGYEPTQVQGLEFTRLGDHQDGGIDRWDAADEERL